MTQMSGDKHFMRRGADDALIHASLDMPLKILLRRGQKYQRTRSLGVVGVCF